MKEWKIAKLESIDVDIIDGDRGINYPQKDEFSSDGYCLFLSTGNVTKDGFDFSNCSFITQLKDNKLRKGKLTYQDVVLTTRGTIGNVVYYGEKIPYKNVRINSGMVILRKKNENVSLEYIYYILKSQLVREQFDLFASGTAQPQLPIKDLKKISIPYPLISIQKRIAQVLSAYDDLIETNNQRIKLLEETAQQLYKEWFVRMRFPDYKKTTFVKGVPEGWEVKKLAELVTTQYGYTASARTENVGLKFLRITDIADIRIDWANVPYCVIPEKERKKYLLQNGDIVVARTGATVGFAKRINKFNEPTVFASYLVRLKPNDLIFNYYLGIIVESEGYKEYIQTVASGSAQPQANAGLMTGYYLFKPSEFLVKKFNLIVEPMFDQREILEQQNTQLRHLRDRLLPRLLSGKLAIKAE
jgi:type I restriction enzyme, S subunit